MANHALHISEQATRQIGPNFTIVCQKQRGSITAANGSATHHGRYKTCVVLQDTLKKEGNTLRRGSIKFGPVRPVNGMAPRHHKTTRSSRLGALPVERRAPGKTLRHKNSGPSESTTATQTGTEIDPKESVREPERQALFQKRSNKTLELPNGYLKVAVLIIRWDPSIDDFEGHTEEVNATDPSVRESH